MTIFIVRDFKAPSPTNKKALSRKHYVKCFGNNFSLFSCSNKHLLRQHTVSEKGRNHFLLLEGKKKKNSFLIVYVIFKKENFHPFL